MEDLQGKQFGRLNVLSFAGTKGLKGLGGRKNRIRYFWHCICDCGTEKDVEHYNLTGGGSTSCGCYTKERTREVSALTNRTHGGTVDYWKEYRTWIHMRKRCNNPKDTGYANYGAIGIKVCDRWNESFENFLADLGPAPGPEYSIDRIDVLGNYEPDNCRWATIKTQNENRRPMIHLVDRSRKEVEQALGMILSKDNAAAEAELIIKELGQWDVSGTSELS